MLRTNIYLSEEQCHALDELAERDDTSRAAVIRRLIDAGLLADRPSLDDDLAAIEASFGAVAEFDPVERADDARAAHLAAVGRRRR